MKKTPMMLQLALILFCIMAIPAAILTWYSGAQIIENSETAIGESALAGLNANRKLNENALANLAQDTARLAATNVFERIRSFETYDEVNASYTNVTKALSVMNELLNLNRRVDGVYSSYFYLNNSDYVISTDNAVTKLERYEQVGWTSEALAGQRGISGVWVPRVLGTGDHVVSYVYPLNRLSSTTDGLIVVNMRESQIGKYLNTAEAGDGHSLLLGSDGKVISHSDKSLLLTDGFEQPFLQEILDEGSSEGYTFRELDGNRMVYAWSRSALSGWWNVSWSSMDKLMTKSRDMQGNIILLTGAIIVLGTVLAVFLATWMSRPLRQLVRMIRSKSNLEVVNKNELAFLNVAFKRMQEEEEGLFQLLQEREQDTRSFAVHRLLRGEIPPRITEIFPELYYRIAVVSIDQYRVYVGNTNLETRSYHGYLLNAKYESLFPEGVLARSVYHSDGCIVIVINFAPGGDEQSCDRIHQALDRIREESLELLGHSVTIGVSGLADAPERVAQRLFEAMELIKQRMIKGAGSVMYWQDEEENSRKYMDSESSERRILNFLDAGDLNGILKELQVIRCQIGSAENISYDNIMFIYHQLLGATIKHLRENHISTGRMIMGKGNIYTLLASMDTLDELEEYLHGFFQEIVQDLDRGTREANHGERIIQYLQDHYREEIVLKDMSHDFGISYSYMRKIVYDLTGKSMIDYLNQLRIEKAKELLLDTDLTIKQIAAEVGYFNVQSFNRFFRKYEGMPPSSYKTAKTKSS
ncbi:MULTISPECIES: helix-turn-helix domain-containing protein [Paenibacillus]|uniref:helix-turn-helix domain-containing protein n=1 Tax=Paenibacillus TaxID=44249 RepID=UPI00096DD773|nr:helix-turn-helix domain-containing protein [Paenibacillus sp. FSL H8-0259]OMF33040.1 AraC family transcriptional regulator [Paenibacillus sp. FSL H8-0259]